MLFLPLPEGYVKSLDLIRSRLPFFVSYRSPLPTSWVSLTRPRQVGPLPSKTLGISDEVSQTSGLGPVSLVLPDTGSRVSTLGSTTVLSLSSSKDESVSRWRGCFEWSQVLPTTTPLLEGQDLTYIRRRPQTFPLRTWSNPPRR